MVLNVSLDCLVEIQLKVAPTLTALLVRANITIATAKKATKFGIPSATTTEINFFCVSYL